MTDNCRCALLYVPETDYADQPSQSMTHDLKWPRYPVDGAESEQPATNVTVQSRVPAAGHCLCEGATPWTCCQDKNRVWPRWWITPPNTNRAATNEFLWSLGITMRGFDHNRVRYTGCTLPPVRVLERLAKAGYAYGCES